MTVKSATRSTIENNIFYRSMLAGNTAFSPEDEFLLEEVVLASSQASVTFDVSSYAGTYRNLQIRIVGKSTDALNDFDNFVVQFNGDTASNYSHHRLFGNGSSVAAYAGTSTSYCFAGMVTRGSTGAFGVSVLDIVDAFETSKYKTTRSLTGGTNTSQSAVVLQSGSWRNTAAISSILLRSESSQNLVAGSRFSIYGEI